MFCELTGQPVISLAPLIKWRLSIIASRPSKSHADTASSFIKKTTIVYAKAVKCMTELNGRKTEVPASSYSTSTHCPIPQRPSVIDCFILLLSRVVYNAYPTPNGHESIAMTNESWRQRRSRTNILAEKANIWKVVRVKWERKAGSRMTHRRDNVTGWNFQFVPLAAQALANKVLNHLISGTMTIAHCNNVLLRYFR